MRAISMGLCTQSGENDNDEEWCAPHIIVDVTQNDSVRSSCLQQRLAPALLKRSKLWELVSDCPIAVKTHWLIQGFVHPEAERLMPGQKSRFPFPSLVVRGGDALTLSEQRALTGNSMHLCVIGSFVAHCLANVQMMPT